jgi:endonuclease-3
MEKIRLIVSSLETLYGGDSFLARESHRQNPFRVLISTILSQRTRDENTARASQRLFSKLKTPHALAEANTSTIENLIKESGFYRIKATRIKQVSRIIIDEYGGNVPDKFSELMRLPGVGRKTANCVLLFGFAKNVIPVDTHVHRISNRLGLVDTTTPEKTEEALKKKIPKRYWMLLNDLFVSFGKDICKPVGPQCERCPIYSMCRWERKKKRKY